MSNNESAYEKIAIRLTGCDEDDQQQKTRADWGPTPAPYERIGGQPLASGAGASAQGCGDRRAEAGAFVAFALLASLQSILHCTPVIVNPTLYACNSQSYTVRL